jgi:hypothetical protein
MYNFKLYDFDRTRLIAEGDFETMEAALNWAEPLIAKEPKSKTLWLRCEEAKAWLKLEPTD